MAHQPISAVSHIAKRVRKGISRSKKEQPVFRALCQRLGLPEPVTEWRFAAPDRKWQFDYAWPESRVALEVEGGSWMAGAHNSGTGFGEDMEKYNAAAERGWVVVRCLPGSTETVRYRKNKIGEKVGVAWRAPALLTGQTVEIVRRVITARQTPPPVSGAVQRGLDL